MFQLDQALLYECLIALLPGVALGLLLGGALGGWTRKRMAGLVGGVTGALTGGAAWFFLAVNAFFTPLYTQWILAMPREIQDKFGMGPLYRLNWTTILAAEVVGAALGSLAGVLSSLARRR